jgi:hypothetical protein
LRNAYPPADTWTLPAKPEIDGLIACALPLSHSELVPGLRAALARPLDGRRLLALAGFHRMQPLLYTRIAEHAPDLIPDSVLAQLASEFRAGVARNLQLTGALIQVVRAFNAAGISALPHKGPLLAQAAYGDLAMREFADLDILILPSDLPKAIAILADLGYRANDRLAWLSPSALLRWTCEMPYASDRGAAVDLHWRLTPSHYPVQLDPEVLWRCRSTVSIAGAELPTLLPAAQLLLLAVHGAKHCWEAIGWLADVAWLAAAHPEAWQGALDLARETQCQRVVELARSLTESVFEGKRSRDPLCTRVLDRWYSGTTASPRSPELLSFAGALAPNRLAMAKHLFGVLFWPTELDWKARRLPEGFFWAYGPIRAAKLAGKYLLRTPAAKTVR